MRNRTLLTITIIFSILNIGILSTYAENHDGEFSTSSFKEITPHRQLNYTDNLLLASNEDNDETDE